ncbi:HAMP domain-containing sensor histidine kinase [Anaerocolumna sp. AGMB13020]|uniref:sensor histidine kinase n=1 Tax=Anaerocolumna sp. AGMB13020 TaxID=3081750 RepID=UPI00295460BD|nr:HAMP domain-containing sensor histidine kinase [Anaerocolumna sp. AGMB13020]WOO39132.1 HAMP domain-containing sensor histidine kinase [Anaerocolumna sp. AGMB13020]
MKSIPKLIRRFLGLLVLSSFLLLVFNILAIAIIGIQQNKGGSPWLMASQTAKAITVQKSGDYKLSSEMTEKLVQNKAWAILIDNESHKVIWHTDNLPEEIPKEYTLSDIVSLTRGYLKDYPTFTGKGAAGLTVVGFPKTSYWKHMYNSWDYDFIAQLPQIVLCVLAGNILIIFLIYFFANTKLIKSLKPLLEGIQDLPEEKGVYLPEKGVMSEIAANINRTSEVLKGKNNQLKKKDTARANWIAGVSHDIRTPLSMVMGYAGQLEEDINLPLDTRKKASVIRHQSERMKHLIQDLNLASKLEYNMQPVNLENINAVTIVRQAVVDFLNLGLAEHPIIWTTKEDINLCMIAGDKALFKRAIANLIQNAINHNEEGCCIYVSVEEKQGHCLIKVEDDGIGADKNTLISLNNAPHYMVCDENTTEQRHGLGLLIVKQIIAAHQGSVKIENSSYGGFSVEIDLKQIH